MPAEAEPDFETLCRAAQARHLSILCTLPEIVCQGRDDLPPGTRSLLMLAPDEPGFWPAYCESPEARDAGSDPMDRWSSRVIGDWATELGATALFPFGGPPFQPFLSWALASGSVHASPVGMLVQNGAGLYVSFRGALALTWPVIAPAALPSPCAACAAPCHSACPVGALGGQSGYDVAACKSWLGRPEGRTCLDQGCLARRACPAGLGHGRLPEHSAYHMAQFLGD